MPALADRILVPPDEKFWQRYSPRHEFPLATVLSIFAHGIVIGALALGVVLLNQSDSDILKPPTMDAVMVEGFGDGGLGGAPEQPGDPKTELAQHHAKEQPKENVAKVAPAQENLLGPSPEFLPSDQADLLKDLNIIVQDVDKITKNDLKKNPKSIAKIVMPDGKGGQGGNRAGGNDKGGSGKRPGTGKDGPGGGGGNRTLTKQQIFSNRWKFELTGSPSEYVDKLVAMGVIVVIADPTNTGYYFLRDLKRRPVELKREDFRPFKDAVQWWPQDRRTHDTLAKGLRLPYTPSLHFLLLPKVREEKMAAEEERFTRANGRDIQQVTETWFDFVLQDGAHEPKAIRQK